MVLRGAGAASNHVGERARQGRRARLGADEAWLWVSVVEVVEWRVGACGGGAAEAVGMLGAGSSILRSCVWLSSSITSYASLPGPASGRKEPLRRLSDPLGQLQSLRCVE